MEDYPPRDLPAPTDSGRLEPEIGTPGSERLPIIAWTLLVILLIGAFVVWNKHRYQFDDAYISYRYAVNLADSEGLVFNPGERVEGFSNFLWVMALAAGSVLGVAPHLLGPPLGVAAYLATIALCWAAIWTPRFRLRLDPGQRVLASVMLIVLVTTRGFAATAGSGLETHFFALLILAGGLALAAANLQTVPSLLALGAVPVALFLTRPDGVVPGAAMIAVAIISSARERSDWRIGLLSGAIMATPAIVGGAAYAIFKLRYFGSVLPNPYWAKGADSLHLDAGWAYIWAFFYSYPVVPAGVLLLVVLLLRRNTGEADRRIASYSLLTVFAYCLFLIKVGGDFMGYRLALQIVPMVVFAAACAVVELAPKRWERLGLISVVIGLSLKSPIMESKFYMQTLEEMNTYTEIGTRVGRSLAHLPPDTKVATTLIGTIGYFSKLTILDQWGLIDPQVRRRQPRPRFFRGHVRPIDRAEARRLGADLFLAHPHLCRCSTACIEYRNQVLIATASNECVRADVLATDPRLIAALCGDPVQFPVTGSAVCSTFPVTGSPAPTANSSPTDRPVPAETEQ